MAKIDFALAQEITAVSGEDLGRCIQCGKCSAACPAGSAMDILPSQIIHEMRCGEVEKLQHCQSLWNCMSCFTCAQRCPRELSVAAIIEALRLSVIRQSGANRIKVEELPAEVVARMPQQLIVSALRKYNK